MGGKWSSMDPTQVEVPKINDLLDRDPYLKPYEIDIRRRFLNFYLIQFFLLQKIYLTQILF